MTSQEPGTPHSADPDSPDTEVIVVSSPASVFVDSTGRRRRLLRRLSYVFGGLCIVYGGLVSVSLAGGPVSSSAVLPLPDPHDTEEAAGPRPAPITPPSVSARPVEVYVADVAPRRRTAPTVTRVAPPRPPVPSKAKPSPSAKPTSAKPVESATVPSSPAPSTTPPPTIPPVKVPVPVPPVKPLVSRSPARGGTGGGGEVPTADATSAQAVSTPVPESADEPVIEESTGPADTPEPSAAAEQTA